MLSRQLFLVLGFLGCILTSVSVQAAGWLLEPSVKLDLGYDDNNYMDIVDPISVGLSKVTAELALRRLSEAHYFKGAVLVDAIQYYGDDSIDPNTNQVVYFSTSFNRQLMRWGVNVNYRRDSLIREASADDGSIEGGEFGDENQDASVDQFLDVVRQRVYINPFLTYNFSRRSDMAINYRLNGVDHDRLLFDDGSSNSLENFVNHSVSVQYGYKLTPLDRIIGKAAVEVYSAERTDNEYVTTSLRLGYERSLSETFVVGGEFGLRSTSFTVDGVDSTNDGVVANVSATKTTGLTKFELKGGVEVYPSSIGQVVQTQELVANVTRNLSELMTFSFKGRAYENTALVTNGLNSNDRRSIELRPELRWELTRNWTAGAAYRYRREKLESKPSSSEGNALLFSIKYTKISELSQQ